MSGIGRLVRPDGLAPFILCGEVANVTSCHIRDVRASLTHSFTARPLSPSLSHVEPPMLCFRRAAPAYALFMNVKRGLVFTTWVCARAIALLA